MVKINNINEKFPELRLNLFPTINLSNAIVGDRDYGKRIDLQKLCLILKESPIFICSFDRRKNPFQNFVQITISNLGFFTGTFWVYSNGTCKTNMPIIDKYKLMVLDMWYRAYVRGCFND
jgi:hypothetical protein